MKNIKSHFKFNKEERSGIFFLLLILVALQLGYFGLKYFPNNQNHNLFSIDVKSQKEIDSLIGARRDSKDSVRYFFNPNFISDYKGYTLGMSPDEIDRLHKYREQNKYVNSADEFKNVTKVSDSLLAAISPYFKFPEWTQGKNTVLSNEKEKKNNQHTIKDLNQITGEELESINGIGKKLSARIIKFRNRLGGFLVDEQLYDVYGLDEEVAGKALQKFKVLKPPLIEKIAINSASASEISKLVYIPYRLAEKIVKKRELVGHYESVEDLLDIPSFPVDRKDRIALYLSF